MAAAAQRQAAVQTDAFSSPRGVPTSSSPQFSTSSSSSSSSLQNSPPSDSSLPSTGLANIAQSHTPPDTNHLINPRHSMSDVHALRALPPRKSVSAYGDLVATPASQDAINRHAAKATQLSKQKLRAPQGFL